MELLLPVEQRVLGKDVGSLAVAKTVELVRTLEEVACKEVWEQGMCVGLREPAEVRGFVSCVEIQAL